MNTWKIALGATLAAGMLAACGDDEETTTDTGTTRPDSGVVADTGVRDTGVTGDTGVQDTGGGGGFTQPPNTVPVNFTINDTANRTYQAGDGLAWKGSFDYDATTRILSLDTGWQPPFPLVYDDGPWNMGGHEPAGATAGDNIWGITVFVEIPTSDPVNFEYGAINGSVDGSDGNWIWGLQSGTNGMFQVPVGASQAINATGLTIPAFGTIDFRVRLDISMADEAFRMGFMPAVHPVEIKSSQWGWSEIQILDNGMRGDATANDGIYTFVLRQNVGPGNPVRNAGGLNPGQTAEFVMVIRDQEYRDTGNMLLTAGVSADISTNNGQTWTPVTIGRAGNGNTTITAPQ